MIVKIVHPTHCCDTVPDRAFDKLQSQKMQTWACLVSLEFDISDKASVCAHYKPLFQMKDDRFVRTS